MLTEREKKEILKIVKGLAFDLGSDVYRSVVDEETAQIMASAAEEVGLPYEARGTVGESYELPIMGSGIARGVLREGDKIVQIIYEDKPEAMSKFWEIVKEARSSSKK